MANQGFIPDNDQNSSGNEGGMKTAIRYVIPNKWIEYNPLALIDELTEAKAGVMSLKKIPYQREWAAELEQMQLKREVAGTSKIEGADFTERELDIALRESPEQLITRSQKQARAALETYRWIATLEDDRPITADLIREIHRRIVSGADDDHCEPGAIRRQDNNVTFGAPRHRGANGGDECLTAFDALVKAATGEYRDRDRLIQALALHYHFAAMHPFQDGNGRTARALEALMLRRAGLRDSLFIAMSNFYYDEKDAYLRALSEVRAGNNDLTPFLKFGLKGIATQCFRLFAEIRNQVSKALFRNVMFDLFDRLKTTKRRVIAGRQIQTLKLLLKRDSLEINALLRELWEPNYKPLKDSRKAFIRDLSNLIDLKAVEIQEISGSDGKKQFVVRIRLEWATEITETTFFEQVQKFPKAKTSIFLQ
jgi:Fic family protein